MGGLQVEFREPYPVYRGLRVPLWEQGRPVSVRRVTDEDRREFMETLGVLRELLQKLVKAWQGTGVAGDVLLEKVADAMALFFKSPLIMEVSPIAPTPSKAHAYVLLLPEKLRVPGDPYAFAESLVEVSGEIRELVKPLFDRRTSELVFDLWTRFPADTRPGYNVSSLVAHLLLTSALAWAIESSRGASRARLAMVRLAAMLHDLGKVVDPERHYEASEQLAKQLLAGVIEEVDAVAKLVREHHLVESSLNRADRLASAADRLTRLVEKLLGGKLREMEAVLGLSSESWEFWRSAYERVEELKRRGLIREDPVRELTEEFLKGLEKLRKEELEEPGESLRGVSLVMIDVGSVQEFIYRSQEIRVVSAASHLIDLIVHAHFLAFLQSVGLRVPPEAVIYSGGGVILLLLPEELAERVLELAERYEGLVGLELYAAKAPFSSSYAFASKLLGSETFLRKHAIKLEGLSVQPLEKVCRLCYSSPSTRSIPTPEGPVDACETCARLYRLGSEFHFKAKWESTIEVSGDRFSPKESFDEGWAKAGRHIMEIIAGHDFEELSRRVQMRDYAVARFDGNMIGPFMLDAVSFADAVERSFRIDMALKRAYIRALEALYRGVRGAAGGDEARKAVSQVYLGTVYMGGDEGLILAPSWAAPLLAHFMAEEFCRQLGLARGLTVAVAAGPARMSVWSLNDCAGELLRAAKEALRRGGNPRVGALAFDLYEAGSPSGSSAIERLVHLSDRAAEAVLGLERGQVKRRRLERRADSAQPFFIDVEDGHVPEAWETVFNVVFELTGWSNNKSFELHEIALGKAFLASRDPSTLLGEDERERLRNLRNAALRSWSEVRDSPYWREKLCIYVLRQIEWREYSELAEAYSALGRLLEATFIRRGEEGIVPLADIITLIKFERGGVR